MNEFHTSPEDLERDLPETEKHNLDPLWEAQKFGMTKEDYWEYQNDAAKKCLRLTMGKDFEQFFNDEGEDVRDLAERDEARAEALWDRKMEQWYEKHQNDKDL